MICIINIRDHVMFCIINIGECGLVCNTNIRDHVMICNTTCKEILDLCQCLNAVTVKTTLHPFNIKTNCSILKFVYKSCRWYVSLPCIFKSCCFCFSYSTKTNTYCESLWKNYFVYLFHLHDRSRYIMFNKDKNSLNAKSTWHLRIIEINMHNQINWMSIFLNVFFK